MAMPAAENDLPAVTPSIGSDAILPLDADIPDHAKKWFPMRIAHGRPERTLAIRKYLTDRQVENFLPMTWKRVFVDGKARRRLLPAIDNLIFIRTTEQRLKDIKRFHAPLLPLRFMMWTSHEDDFQPSIITIADRDMANFQRVASVEDDSVMFLGNTDFSQKIGHKVKVIFGPFEGVEGKVCRVKKDRRVVVTLDGVCSVAIAHISPDHLLPLD